MAGFYTSLLDGIVFKLVFSSYFDISKFKSILVNIQTWVTNKTMITLAQTWSCNLQEDQNPIDLTKWNSRLKVIF